MPVCLSVFSFFGLFVCLFFFGGEGGWGGDDETRTLYNLTLTNITNQTIKRESGLGHYAIVNQFPVC